METTLYFVRHGHVENPRQVAYMRLPRFRLSEVGLQQAASAAQMLKDKHPAAIYTSPMLRARQTAQIIAAHHSGVKIHISSLINENYSPFQGTPIAEIQARDWDIFTGIQPPYERPADMLARLLRFIERARRKHPGQAVIAVTHGDPIRFLMGWAMGYSVDTEFNDMQYPETGSVVALTYLDGQDQPNLKIFTPLASKPL